MSLFTSDVIIYVENSEESKKTNEVTNKKPDFRLLLKYILAYEKSAVSIIWPFIGHLSLLFGSFQDCLFMLDVCHFIATYLAVDLIPTLLLMYYFSLQSCCFSSSSSGYCQPLSLTISSLFPLFSTSGTFVKTVLEPFHLTIIS